MSNKEDTSPTPKRRKWSVYLVPAIAITPILFLLVASAIHKELEKETFYDRKIPVANVKVLENGSLLVATQDGVIDIYGTRGFPLKSHGSELYMTKRRLCKERPPFLFAKHSIYCYREEIFEVVVPSNYDVIK